MTKNILWYITAAYTTNILIFNKQVRYPLSLLWFSFCSGNWGQTALNPCYKRENLDDNDDTDDGNDYDYDDNNDTNKVNNTSWNPMVKRHSTAPLTGRRRDWKILLPTLIVRNFGLSGLLIMLDANLRRRCEASMNTSGGFSSNCSKQSQFRPIATRLESTTLSGMKPE